MCAGNRFSYIALFRKAVLSIASMGSMHAIAGGLGTCPSGNFLKLHALKLNFQEYVQV